MLKPLLRRAPIDLTLYLAFTAALLTRAASCFSSSSSYVSYSPSIVCRRVISRYSASFLSHRSCYPLSQSMPRRPFVRLTTQLTHHYSLDYLQTSISALMHLLFCPRLDGLQPSKITSQGRAVSPR
ncbi:hypothetical protein BD309DRAFT_440431 [Dichomitus squalens]|uniref:Uncharacterized protein n=1 Tax=Dichomitus squalens TaxID=114155 RepID=A0A4Q9PBY2_9APHY|nr:hypothetical protein BD309DRAFT_440431 [Dichomitus squalens]TBU52280.1 hypothetical protein BD310DRAFT_244889 [Dichomitus squalens]